MQCPIRNDPRKGPSEKTVKKSPNYSRPETAIASAMKATEPAPTTPEFLPAALAAPGDPPLPRLPAAPPAESPPLDPAAAVVEEIPL